MTEEEKFLTVKSLKPGPGIKKIKMTMNMQESVFKSAQ